jgi:thiol-disulfide isomerase/thioredoxin
VGNWAGVTVDRKEHPIKKVYARSEQITAVDLPGAYSMSPFTSEESITSSYVQNESPDVIINIVDADNLSRSLFFTTQLLELGIPVVVALNKSDIGKKKGNKIDIDALSEKLGCPVVKTVSTSAEGLKELIETAVAQIGKEQTAIYIHEDIDLNDKAQVEAALNQFPQFKSSTRVNNYIAALSQKERTSPGKKYIDFEITYDGKTSKLSDYVKPGKYTIVDFWASWCGPCMRQAVVLKEIYAEYKDKGLEIVGVAVWDEPQNTLEAIKTKELPWHNILNAQTIPTDLYGISGIPCIIIIGPDGTILSRDKQGDELKADVRKALAGELK